MTKASDELVKRARFLRNAAPQEFQNFAKAFTGYMSQRIEALLYATDNLQIVQGQAQQCAKIAELLEEAEKNG